MENIFAMNFFFFLVVVHKQKRLWSDVEIPDPTSVFEVEMWKRKNQKQKGPPKKKKKKKTFWTFGMIMPGQDLGALLLTTKKNSTDCLSPKVKGANKTVSCFDFW
jgi:hypothetical protein